MAEHVKDKVYYLKRINSQDKEYELIPFIKDEFVVGRSIEANFEILHENISRRHAVFFYRDGIWNVKNCSSSGILHNNSHIPRNLTSTIHPGDILQFGQHNLFCYEFREKKLTKQDLVAQRSSKMELSEQKTALEDRLRESETLKDSLLKEKDAIERSLKEENLKLQHQFIKEQSELERKYDEGILAQKCMLEEKEALKSELNSKVLKMESKFEAEKLSLELRLQKEEETKLAILQDKQNVMTKLQAENEALQKRLEEEKKRMDNERMAHKEKLLTLERQRVELEEEVQLKNSTMQERMQMEEEQRQAALRLEKEKLNLQNRLEAIEEELAEKSLVNALLEGELTEKVEADRYKQVLEEKQTLEKQLEEANKQCQMVSNLQEEKASLDEVKETPSTIEEVRKNIVGSVTEVVENEFQCPVCTEIIITAITINCGHTLCQYCINEWKKNKKTCPTCRAQITTEARSLLTDNFIEKIVTTLSEEMKAKRQKLIKEREATIQAAKEQERQRLEEQMRYQQQRRGRGGRGRRRGGRRDRVAERYNNPTPTERAFNVIRGIMQVSHRRRGRGVSVNAPIVVPDGAGAVPEAGQIITLDNESSSSSSSSGTDSGTSPMLVSSDESDNSDDYLSGDPDVYYGGYGRCYNCGRQGHWANGCPERW